MVQFTATIHKFGKKGEKTGWTYFEMPADIVQQLKPGNKKEFKVKGKLDGYAIRRVSVLPMGGGLFIMPLNTVMRRAIGKKQGAILTVQLTEDKSDFVFNKDFMDCLDDEPAAKEFFQSLKPSKVGSVSGNKKFCSFLNISLFKVLAITFPSETSSIFFKSNFLDKKFHFARSSLHQ